MKRESGEAQPVRQLQRGHEEAQLLYGDEPGTFNIVTPEGKEFPITAEELAVRPTFSEGYFDSGLSIINSSVVDTANPATALTRLSCMLQQGKSTISSGSTGLGAASSQQPALAETSPDSPGVCAQSSTFL